MDRGTQRGIISHNTVHKQTVHHIGDRIPVGGWRLWSGMICWRGVGVGVGCNLMPLETSPPAAPTLSLGLCPAWPLPSPHRQSSPDPSLAAFEFSSPPQLLTRWPALSFAKPAAV